MKVIVTTHPTQKGESQNVCIQIPFENLMLSISVDNSCGAKQYCFREDIRVFRRGDDKDVTDIIFSERATAYNGVELKEVLDKVAQADKLVILNPEQK